MFKDFCFGFRQANRNEEAEEYYKKGARLKPDVSGSGFLVLFSVVYKCNSRLTVNVMWGRRLKFHQGCAIFHFIRFRLCQDQLITIENGCCPCPCMAGISCVSLYRQKYLYFVGRMAGAILYDLNLSVHQAYVAGKKASGIALAPDVSRSSSYNYDVQCLGLACSNSNSVQIQILYCINGLQPIRYVGLLCSCLMLQWS